jgi:alpha-tubulin suppressor-like RCC1 family protein
LGKTYALGNGSCESTSYFIPINSLIGANTKKIMCGSYMSGCTTHEGKAYQWGTIQTQDKKVMYKLPTQIVLDATSSNSLKHTCNYSIIDLKMGDCFTIALTEEGIYGWGNNQYGQLGNGTFSSVCTPMRLHLDDKPIQVFH